MGLLGDILKALESSADWKRIKPLPDEVAELRKRIERLEAHLGATSAGGLQQCQICNSLQFKRTGSTVDATFGWAGVKTDSYHCQSCGHRETRQRDEGPPGMR